MGAHAWTWLLVGVSLLAQGAPEEKGIDPIPTAEEIAAAIERLGHDDYQVREEATDFLWRAGDAAITALEAATKSTDAEVRIRAADVLNRFRNGIFPDTPPESAELILLYRNGNHSQKSMAINRLRERKDHRTLLRLLRGESDATVRRMLASSIRSHLSGMIAIHLEQGETRAVQELLELDAAMGSDNARRQLAMLLLLSGGLNERRAALATELKDSTDAEWLQTLATLHLAAGDEKGVAETLARTGDTLHQLTAAVRNGKWDDAAKTYDLRFGDWNTPTLEQLGYSAMYHRLAGHEDIFQERLKELRAFHERSPGNGWFVMEILLLNEQVEEAIAGLSKIRPAAAFELLCVRQEFKRAFALAGIEPGRKFDRAWFDSLPSGDGAGDELMELNRRHVMALEVGYFLHLVGRASEASEVFTTLREINRTTTDNSLRWRQTELCRILARLGRNDEAFDVAAEYLRGGTPVQILPRIFPQHGSSATHWYYYARDNFKEQTLDERVQWIRRLLEPKKEERSSDEWREIIAKAGDGLDKLDDALRAARVTAIVDSALAHGQRAVALKYLQRDDLSPPQYLRLGDLLREDQKYEEAAKAYARAVPKEGERALPLFLRGHALIKQGEKEQGERQQQIALMTALDDNARQQLLQGLMTRKLRDEVAMVRDLWQKTSPEISVTLSKDLGNAFAPADLERATDYWQLCAVQLTNTGAGLLEDAGYLTLPHQIHRGRAKAQLAKGNREAFRRELAACRAILPNDWGLVEELVPQLDEKGWKEEADALFAAQKEELEELCRDFPESPRFSNALAWVSAVCRRDLDRALELANKTLKLAPDNPSYLDTLAEVHHARGEHQEAIKVQQRVVELAPDVDLFRQRLAKFEAAAKEK